jgi:ectoine hydroxylase-related dioxygenase (phytanoyl-CoA dioxygenase family)
MGIELRFQQTIWKIAPSEAERTAGVLAGGTIEHAAERFRIDGALIIEDIVDTAIIAAARQAFGEGYSHHLDGSVREDALMVDSRRLIIPIDLEPPFDNPQLFANSYLLALLSGALDDGFVISAFGVVCSLPSAPAQHRHADGGTLFPRSGIDRLLPAAAITVGIPLLEMNEVHGTTAVWLGSHREPSRESKEEGIEPVVREGSCMLWDFRLMHCGTPNRSTVPRPLLYLTYCRPWFVDHLNGAYNPKYKPLIAKKDFLRGLSEQHQRMLARAQEG